MRFLAAPLALFVIAVSGVAAQPLPPQLPDRFEGTGPNPVPIGGDLTVQYTDPGNPNGTVTVTAKDGTNPSDTRTITIVLGPGGSAKELFSVPPGWGSVILTEPASADHTVPVDGDIAPAEEPLESESDQEAAHAVRPS